MYEYLKSKEEQEENEKFIDDDAVICQVFKDLCDTITKSDTIINNQQAKLLQLN